MTNTFRSCGVVFGLTVLAGVISGCDQTADEYHDQQVSNKLALYNSVSGNYVGTVTTQSGACNLQVGLSPAVNTTTSTDGTSSQPTAELQGSVTVNCGSWTATEAVSQIGYFSKNNSKSGTFEGNFPISFVNAGQTMTAQMEISGTITNGSQMSGTIQMTTPSATTGTFSASIGGTGSATGADSGVANGHVALQQYKGKYTSTCPDMVGQSPNPLKINSACIYDVTMTTELLPQEDSNFYNFWATQKLVSVQLNTTVEQVVGPDGTVYTNLEVNPVGLQNAKLDGQHHTLDVSQSGVGANGGTVTLHCDQVGLAMDCTLVGMTSGSSVYFSATPSSN
jgi:hypothetical protein